MRLFATLLIISTSPAAFAAQPQALHCERLFDARSGKVLGEHTIVVRDGKIESVLPGRAKLADGITSTLTHILEGLPTDCSVCQLKEVCDEVDGMKELHFGKAARDAEKEKQ